ncbi:UDP-glucosyltransferase 2-like isoform X1 [Colletes gigas]|uniref:UDP-glucosyltransferase 2-like isoform X1 n=1 Tax=Colletes gigas TaxID=935657 RepID=UPI001C9AADCB|nr:UDP-glucosyltransferase 2-like isoform X1 [Colletes gigas]
MKFVIISILCIFCILKRFECARILVVIATPSYSHQITYNRLFLELNKRGHEIVFITTNYIRDLDVTNITQINIEKSYELMKDLDFIRYRYEGISWLTFLETNIRVLGDGFLKNTFEHPMAKELYSPNSNATFDVVMTEMLFTPGACALAHRFNAPLIGLSSFGLPAFQEYILGGLVLPSHESTWENVYTGTDPTFWDRVKNFVGLWRHLYICYQETISRQHSMVEKYFGKSIPPLIEIIRNITLVFINNDEFVSPARLKSQNHITFSTLQISENPTPLPKDLKHFVDNAKNGFIYFNLGTNVRSASLPNETIRIFRDVFAKLPYRVVWKFEMEFPEKPDNVFAAPWFPQQTILAHPNIKLFVYQGGIQSTEETIHFAVPVLGFPVMADQDYQVRRMVKLGVGKCLEITTVDSNEFESAIREIISNKEYKQNMLKLRDLTKDTPYDYAKYLAWWTEFVIRYKGAPHLRSTVISQPWYQRNDMDIVISFTILTYILVSYTFRLIIKLILRTCKQRRINSVHLKQKTS